MTRRGFLSNLFRRGLPGSHAKADWNVDRRGFVGWILSALSAVIWPFIRAGELKRARKQEQREALIAAALETDEGRQALAQAMLPPIRRALEYQAIGRKLLMVQELPDGVGPPLGVRVRARR